MKKVLRIALVAALILAVLAPAALGYLYWYNSTHYIGRAAAVSAAIADAGYTADQVYDIDTDLEVGRGAARYEVDFRASGGEYDYVVNAVTGEILSTGVEND